MVGWHKHVPKVVRVDDNQESDPGYITTYYKCVRPECGETWSRRTKKKG